MSVDAANKTTAGQFPRLSDRFRVEGLSVECVVPNQRKFGRKTATIQMSVVDLSIAGALFIGPKIDGIRSGSKVPFSFEGAKGIAQVRHVRPAHDVSDVKNPAYYGVVFVEIPTSMKELIFARMAERRGRKLPELDELWNQAR